ncbi:MAG: hypothetical protein HY898_20180 [Deltaproteobacteria bacterium]|nr:hypothetical protein [Deltaproteobacteria bacterium]
MTRQTLVSSLAILVLGALGVACKSGGVGDPCIPNLEYSATDPGAVETGAQIEDRSFQCETRVCLINHFRGRVTCPWGNTEGGSAVANAACYVPGTNVKVSQGVRPQCRERKDNVYCSCRCAGADSAAKYCECPAGYVCDEVTKSLDSTLMAKGDKYCVKEGNNASQDSSLCKSDGCDVGDMCGYTENKQQF